MTYSCSIDEEKLTKECTNFSYTPGLEKSPLITQASHTTHINIHSFTGTSGDDRYDASVRAHLSAHALFPPLGHTGTY